MTNPADPRSIITGGEPSSLLGPSEPNWATQVRSRRLAGLLNLSCLLSEVTLITDTDVSENANFLESFRLKQPDGLYARLREFVRLGFIRILLRDEHYRPDRQTPIGTFTDLYNAWLEHDPPDAWVLRDFSSERRNYYADLDAWAMPQTVRYPYRNVKELFMQNLRLAASYSADTAYMSILRSLPSALQTEYFAMLDRPWFSLTSVNQLFQRHGLTIDDPAMHFQGLLNQITYSSFAGASLVGVDADSVTHGSVQVPDGVKKKLARVDIDEIMERADALLDGPSLAILGQLRPDEIAHLRTRGRSYFALLGLSRDYDFRASERPDTGRLFVDAATSYWAEVCEYVRSSYGPLVEKRTRLGVFLGYDPTRQLSLPQEVVSLAVEAGAGALSAGGVPAGGEIAKTAKSALGMVKLRFLFVSPTEDFRRIQRVLPRSFWFRRSYPEVLP